MSNNKIEENEEKKTKTKEDAKRFPVFRLKPYNKTNTATIKYVGFYNDTEKLGDEIIELDRQYKSDEPIGKNVIPLKRLGKFSISIRFFRCNIVGSHIIVSRRYPLMYLDVSYEKPLVTGSLFQIFISLDMNKDDKKKIKEHKEYVNLKIKGDWFRHIDCDDELRENYEKLITEMLETDALEKLYKSTDNEIIKTRELLTETTAIDWVNKYVEEEKKFYDSLINEQQIKFTSLLKTRDDFIDLCTSERFYKFVEIAMRCRDIHRRKEHGLDDESIYVVPKEEDIIKLDDIEKRMMENGEIVFDD